MTRTGLAGNCWAAAACTSAAAASAAETSNTFDGFILVILCVDLG